MGHEVSATRCTSTRMNSKIEKRVINGSCVSNEKGERHRENAMKRIEPNLAITYEFISYIPYYAYLKVKEEAKEPFLASI